VADIRTADATRHRAHRTRDGCTRYGAADGAGCRPNRTIRFVPGRTAAKHREDCDYCRCLRCISGFHLILHRLDDLIVVASTTARREAARNTQYAGRWQREVGRSPEIA
jgi:hypothetical protein